jgi:hypothetical protein
MSATSFSPAGALVTAAAVQILRRFVIARPGAQPGVRRDDLLQQVALANQPVEPDGSRHCAGSNCDMAPTARA